MYYTHRMKRSLNKKEHYVCSLTIEGIGIKRNILLLAGMYMVLLFL